MLYISNKKNILILISTFSIFAIFIGITFSFFSTRTTDNKTGCLKWYTFLDDGNDTINLLLDHNTTATSRWSSTSSNDTGGDAVHAQLASDVSLWHQDVKNTSRLISAQEIANITKHPTFDETSSDPMAWYWFETLTNSCSQCSTLGKGNAKYDWLFDRIGVFGCETYGCSNNPIGINQYGYWTSSKPAGNFVYAWYVYLTGQTYFRYVDDSTYIGVRPVITVSKSKL